MNFIDRDSGATGRLVLALLLALGFHAALFLGIPADQWPIRLPKSLRFEVVLLPPVTRTGLPGSPTASPKPAQPDLPLAPSAATPVQDSASPTPISAPAAIPPISAPEPISPAASTPSPGPPTAIPPEPPLSLPMPATKSPPKPVVPATKSPPKPVVPAKPSIMARTTPAPRVAVTPNASSQSVGAPEPIPPSIKQDFSATAKSAPQSTRPNRRSERLGGSGTAASTGVRGRLDSSALLGQIASLETQAQRRANANVRSKRVNPSDTRSPEGFYIAAWVRKVEQIGEMNFPDVARKLNLSTGPVLDVAIRADGSLQDVRVIRSSGNAELDLAAQRIVKLGAPYAPFPSALRQQYDVLYISRPWRFEPGGRLRTR